MLVLKGVRKGEHMGVNQNRTEAAYGAGRESLWHCEGAERRALPAQLPSLQPPPCSQAAPSQWPMWLVLR